VQTVLQEIERWYGQLDEQKRLKQMSENIEIDESKAMKLIMLFEEPEYKDLTPNPLSCYVKVGLDQMENN
jgi:hypothetical protein